MADGGGIRRGGDQQDVPFLAGIEIGGQPESDDGFGGGVAGLGQLLDGIGGEGGAEGGFCFEGDFGAGHEDGPGGRGGRAFQRRDGAGIRFGGRRGNRGGEFVGGGRRRGDGAEGLVEQGLVGGRELGARDAEGFALAVAQHDVFAGNLDEDGQELGAGGGDPFAGAGEFIGIGEGLEGEEPDCRCEQPTG